MLGYAINLGGDIDEIADAGVLNGDALWLAGGAGGINDIGKFIVGCRAFFAAQPVIGKRVDGFAIALAIDKNGRQCEFGQFFCKARQRQYGLDFGVFQNKANAVVRKTCVKRHIGGIDFQNC